MENVPSWVNKEGSCCLLHSIVLFYRLQSVQGPVRQTSVNSEVWCHCKQWDDFERLPALTLNFSSQVHRRQLRTWGSDSVTSRAQLHSLLFSSSCWKHSQWLWCSDCKGNQCLTSLNLQQGWPLQNGFFRRTWVCHGLSNSPSHCSGAWSLWISAQLQTNILYIKLNTQRKQVIGLM